jgi:hypothetical protein
MLETPRAAPSGRLLITAFLGAMVWAVAHWVASPNLDRYHDMLESYAWSQTFEWGTFKHPPLFSWATGLWFSLFPKGDLSFKFLAYTNVAVGLLGVAALASACGLAREARATIVLLLVCLPYTTLAAKFNANSQLLSIWPWTATALVCSLKHPGWQGMLWSTALGALAALAMLGKYYSGVLLIALFAVALIHHNALGWFTSPRPWWALAVMLAALTPHALWLRDHGFVLLGYALDQGGGHTHWGQVRNFALLPFVYWLPGWWLCAAVFTRTTPREGRIKAWLRNLIHAWKPQGFRDTVFWLAFLPWALTLALGIAGVVELSSPWAIPLGFAFPLLWLRNLAGRTDRRPAADKALEKLTSTKLSLVITAGVLCCALILAILQAKRGSADYYRPTEQAAVAITSGWQKRHPGVPLGWSAGAWPDTAMMPFYGDTKIRALPFAPDSREAAVAPHPRWREEGGVLICPRGSADQAVLARSGASDCERRAISWLRDMGLPTSSDEVRVQREGWRFPRPQEWSYAVFDVLPEQGTQVKPP